MQNKIILVSEDSNFFDYINSKLKLRKNDEVICFTYENLLKNIQYISNSVLIFNSVNSSKILMKTLELIYNLPKIVFGYEDDDELKIKLLEYNVLAYFTPIISDLEFELLLKNLLNMSSIIKKNNYYKKILQDIDIIDKENEVFIDHERILTKEFERIQNSSEVSILAAVTINNSDKIEEIERKLINNVRKNDVLIKFGKNKYFLILNNTSLSKLDKKTPCFAKNLDNQISYGFSNIIGKKKNQIIDEALNNMYIQVKKFKEFSSIKEISFENFKQHKQNLKKQIHNITVPAFYQIKEKFSEKLFKTSIKIDIKDDMYILTLSNCKKEFSVNINYPGYTIINIDLIMYIKGEKDSSRIKLKPEEYNFEILMKVLEHFVKKYKEELNYGFN